MCKQQTCLQPTHLNEMLLSPLSLENVLPPCSSPPCRCHRFSATKPSSSSYSSSSSSTSARRQWMTQSVVRRTAAQVENYLEALGDTTPFLQQQPPTAVALLQRSEIIIADRNNKTPLGTGGFSRVYAVQAVHLSSDISGSCTPQQQVLRQQLADQVNNNGMQLAVKVLQSELLLNNKGTAFSRAACDLVAEAHYLERLQQHEGIVRLAALPWGGVQAWKKLEDYFIVMERLDCTLADRLRDESTSPATNPTAASQQQRLLRDYMLPVAKALQYLHSHRLVFRDLKPQNIGIALDGRVVLFDFGLCRQLPTTTATTSDELFEMSGVGTRRYMAPETLSLLSPCRYNQQADIYSWTMITWQVLTGCRPFARYGTQDHLRAVVTRQERPRFLPSWPPELQTILRCGWHHDPTLRWTSATMVQALERYCCTTLELRDQAPLSPVSVTAAVRMMANDSKNCTSSTTTTTKDSVMNIRDLELSSTASSSSNTVVANRPTLVLG